MAKLNVTLSVPQQPFWATLAPSRSMRKPSSWPTLSVVVPAAMSIQPLSTITPSPMLPFVPTNDALSLPRKLTTELASPAA